MTRAGTELGPARQQALATALADLEPALPEMEELLRDLVEINSFTDNLPGVAAVGARLDAFLAGACDGALKLERRPGGRQADQLAWSTPSAAAAAAVVLVGHADTVFPPGTFEGYRRDGELARGPGVLDMKGGLVVAAFALRALHRSGLLASLPLRLAVVSDEEVGSPESQAFLTSLCREAGAALVLEAGRKADAIITRRKGTGGLTVIAHGRAAHAGNFHAEGRNAIWALARFIDRAQQLTSYEVGVTVNVGQISGGLGKNTVPDRAEALLDFRYVRPEDGAALVARVHELAAEVARELEGTRLDVKGGISRAPLYRDEAVAALAARYAECQALEGLGTGEAPLLGGGSDASTAQAAGCPAIDGLGPRGTGFHTHDELVELATFVPKARALVRFLILHG